MLNKAARFSFFPALCCELDLTFSMLFRSRRKSLGNHLSYRVVDIASNPTLAHLSSGRCARDPGGSAGPTRRRSIRVDAVTLRACVHVYEAHVEIGVGERRQKVNSCAVIDDCGGSINQSALCWALISY